MNPGEDSSLGRTITTLSSREVYRNPWMRVREDEILRSNGKRGIFGVVEKDDAAIILPIDMAACGWWSSSATPLRSVRWNCRRADGRWKSRTPKSWLAAS
jgi:hypothetical protein